MKGKIEISDVLPYVDCYMEKYHYLNDGNFTYFRSRDIYKIKITHNIRFYLNEGVIKISETTVINGNIVFCASPDFNQIPGCIDLFNKLCNTLEEIIK